VYRSKLVLPESFCLHAVAAMHRFVLLIILLAILNCGKNRPQRDTAIATRKVPTSIPKTQLFGVWLKAIEGQEGFEGFQFETSGKVRFVNMYTIVGDKWELLAGDSLRIWAFSGNISEARAVTYKIAELDSKSLALRPRHAAPDFQFVYHRPAINRPTDRWIGRWTGEQETFLDLTPRGENYRLLIKTAERFNIFTGYVEGTAVRFERNSKTEYIRLASGKEIGGQRLAGEEECLVIQVDERFCR
jgi:hypothetical protein